MKSEKVESGAMIDIKPTAADYLQRSSSTTINNITMLFAGNFLCNSTQFTTLLSLKSQKVAKNITSTSSNWRVLWNTQILHFLFADSSYKSSWGAHTTQPAGNYQLIIASLSIVIIYTIESESLTIISHAEVFSSLKALKSFVCRLTILHHHWQCQQLTSSV